jgi:hypothetical protein
VRADEELCAAIREGPNVVGVPDFLKQAFSHGKDRAVVRGGRKNCMGQRGLSKPHAGRVRESCDFSSRASGYWSSM